MMQYIRIINEIDLTKIAKESQKKADKISQEISESQKIDYKILQEPMTI